MAANDNTEQLKEFDDDDDNADENIESLELQLRNTDSDAEDKAPTDEDESNKKMKEDSFDLSTFKGQQGAHISSALPHVLEEYGLPQQKKKSRNKTVKISNEKKKSRKNKDYMSDIDLDRQRIREERQMQVYEDVHKLRDFYYQEYMDVLREKIRKQKEAIQKKSDALESRLRKNELMKREQSHRLKKRMVRSKLSHDDSFLRGIPKTQFYKIVLLHDRLKSQGKLKTQSDIDAFWKNIRRPEVYRKQFGSDSGDSVATSLRSSLQHGLTGSTSSYQSTGQAVDGGLGQRQLTQISESKESRPTTREVSWTTNQHIRIPSKSPVDPYVIAKQAALALDKKCPQVPLPQMSCFTMELGEKEPDPDMLKEQAETIAREKGRKKFVKTLRKMYNLSLAHATTTTRILEKHTSDFALALEGPAVSDLGMFDLSALQNTDDLDEVDDDGAETWRNYLRRRTYIDPIQEEAEKVSSRQSSAPARSQGSQTHSRVSSSKSQKSHRSKRSPEAEEIAIPLTLESIAKEDSILEAKCLSTLWTNHMGMWKGPAAEKQTVVS